ncbi:MAG: proton-conducting transporter membrane subunit [Dehalococcoidia bacterium]
MPFLVLALVLPLVGRWWPHTAFPIALFATVGAAVAALLGLANVMQNGAMHYHLGGWAPPLGIELVLDHISAFVSLVILSVASVVVIATRRHVIRIADDRLGSYYSVMLLLLLGITGIILTGDVFNLFVFLEIASISAYALIFMGGRSGMIAAFRYLILGTIASSLYLLGVGFLYFSTGTLNMAEMQQLLGEVGPSRSVEAAAVFILAGLGLKMALMPLHFWLPDAYNFAPSAVNSLLAPIMTKAAAYAIIRMFISVFPPGYLQEAVPIADALLILGLIGVIVAPIIAVAQKDIRRLLAYSSISQLSLIAVGIGLANPLGLVAALLHIMNHTVIKATLFLSAASIRRATGSSLISDMTGLGRKMPLTFAAFSLAAIAMIGFPPFAGFFSKLYVAQAGVEAGHWIVVAAVLASTLLTAAYLFKVLEQAYLRPARPDAHGHEEEVDLFPLTHGHSASLALAIEASPDAEIHRKDPASVMIANAKESPRDLVLPALFLGIMTLVLGVFNVYIVTSILEPAVS